MNIPFSQRNTMLSCAIAAVFLTACGGSNTDMETPKAINLGVFSGPPSGAPAAEVVNFTGPRNNYTIARTATGFSVTDTVGTGGTVQVSATANLKFSDMTLNLSVGDKSKTIPAESLKNLLELYVAFFNRVPDADGISYWIDRFKAGMTLDQIADSFYEAAVQYSSLTGYSSTMTNADFVRIIYKNVLGRSGATAPPDEDVNYWAGQLSSGAYTRGHLIITMLSSARSYVGDATYGWVPQLLDNKVSVGSFFSIEEGINYNTDEESITKTMDIVSRISASDILAARNYINIKDSSFNLTKTEVSSGSGDSKDCYNTDLFKPGVTYRQDMRSTIASNGIVSDYTVDYKPNGTTTFKGNSAYELWATTTVTSGPASGTKSLIKSYFSVTDTESLNYGAEVGISLQGLGDYKVISTMTPPKRVVFSMAINKPYSQTYTVKQEAVGSPFPITYPDTEQTEVLTFMGIESVTVPAGTYNACKFKYDTTTAGKTGTSYTWQVSDRAQRGLTAKITAEDVTTVAMKLVIN